MVDVSTKDITLRIAKASGRIVLGDMAFDVVEAGTS
jgi:molybdenum cofactor biosynthesis enzyme